MELGAQFHHRQMTVVKPSVEDVVLSSGESNENFTSHRRERLGLFALIILVTTLAVVMFRTSNNAVDNLKTVSNSGSTTYNMVITQRESLVFAVAFEQWLGGTITRRDLQIRRAILAQRLVVRDDVGVTNGTRIGSEYFKALDVLDNYMEEAVPGILPLDDRIILRSQSAEVLEQFTFESREVAVRISQTGDEQIRQLIRDENSNRMNQYTIVLVVLALMALVAILLEVARRRDHRMIRARARNERQELERIREALQQADLALASRLEIDRLDRLDREWIDSGTRSILAKMKGTVIGDEIAEYLVEGLGRRLGADFVIFYSFSEFQNSRILKQWGRTTATQIDISGIADYESRLMDLAKRLEKRSKVIVVNDSHLVDVSRDRFPDLLAISQDIVRSWVMASVGEAIHGMGYVWIGMVESPRVWTSKEVAFVQQMVADAAPVMAHARIFNQAMRIAENDAEVNRLIELDKVKDDFIENMNHELRTPLTSIIGYLEMIIGDVDPGVEPMLASSLGAVQRNAIRLQSLIENMMQVSKTNFHDVPLVVSTVDIGHLLGDVVKSMELAADDRGVKVTLRLDSRAADLIIDGDINQLEQVFVNLISNALKFTPRGGKVAVIARRMNTGGDFVEVKVTDTGIGIPPKEFPNVFKRFFRASTATQAAIPGFGIGLSLVQSIVREHHGTVGFDSTVGKGTVFTVTLPARYISIRPPDETV